MKPCDETTEAIVEAALTVFGRHGLDEASIDDVARAAGVDQGAVYLRFSSKDELFADVARRVSDRILDELATAVACARTPGDKLRALIATSVTAFSTIAAEHRLDAKTLAELVPRGMAHRQAHLARERSMILEVLCDGNASGAFAVERPERLATGIVMCLEGLDAIAAQRRSGAASAGLDELVSVIVRGVASGRAAKAT